MRAVKGIIACCQSFTVRLAQKANKPAENPGKARSLSAFFDTPDRN
jgi:hypothetical protein